MGKFDHIRSGTSCAALADMMGRTIGQSPARISDLSQSNQMHGGPSSERYVDPRCRSSALTAMPLPQLGWCRILLRS